VQNDVSRCRLAELLGCHVDELPLVITQDEARELVREFDAMNDALAQLPTITPAVPARAAYLLRLGARACHRFAARIERIEALEYGREAREIARRLEGLANELEGLEPGTELPSFLGCWW
jgi:hypothetical protein